MNRLRHRRLVAAIGTLLLAGAAAAAPTWHVTDLGALKARNDTVAGINAAGVVAGTYGNLGAEFDHGTIARIHDMGSKYATATGINDAGVVVGTGHDIGFAFAAYTWTGGKPKALTGLGGADTTANAINQAGMIAGASDIGDSRLLRACRYEDGVAVDLGLPPGASQAEGMGIDEAGNVVGRAIAAPGYLPFVYRDGAMQNLPVSGNGMKEGWALGINGHGTIVGLLYDGLGQTQAVTWDASNVMHLVVDSLDAEAFGINDSGHVVGHVDAHGFFNDGSRTFQLDQHLDAGSGAWRIGTANAINADDAIAATGVLTGRTVHALLLTRVK